MAAGKAVEDGAAKTTASRGAGGRGPFGRAPAPLPAGAGPVALAGAGLAVAALAATVALLRVEALGPALAAALLFAAILMAAIALARGFARTAPAPDPAVAAVETARDEAFALAEAAMRRPDVPRIAPDTAVPDAPAPVAGGPDIEVRVGLDGRVTALDTAAETVLGPAAGRVVGRPLADLSPHPAVDGEAAAWEALRQALLPGSAPAAQAPGEAEDEPRPAPALAGDVPLGPPEVRRWYAFSTEPVLIAGRPVGWRLIGRDVTARRAVEEALRAATQRAEAASAAKSRFLAMVSHEIRTPLNGILGMTGLLMQTALTAEQRTYARAVETSGEALLLLIEDLLDFSKIEAGRLDLAPRPTALCATVEELVELLSPRATAKGLELAAYVDPTVPDEVLVDPIRLKQVLFNLAGNGLKFTAEGGVAVEVWSAGPPDAAGRRPVLFQVRDTGVGIRPEDSERIFREFEQADAGRDRIHDGAGLGLAIAREIVRLMGGEITVDSRPGAGACFSFTVPLAAAGAATGPPVPVGPAEPAEPAADGQALHGARAAQERLFSIFAAARPPEPAAVRPLAPEPLAGRRVLVVSHALIEGPFLVRRLFDAGAVAILATQREVEVSLKEIRPDAVLVDAAAADPFALMERIKVAGEVPAAVLIDPRERPLLPDLSAAGYGAYLVKPVRARSLVAAMAMLFDGGAFGGGPARDDETEGGAADEAREAAVAAGLRVLLCDDNDINLLLGRALLERLGADVATAGDGRRAIQAALEARAAGRPFDLVLMDLRMPEMDGVEAARRIGAALGADAPPVAALTAEGAGEAAHGPEPGLFVAHLVKPLLPDALEQLVSRLRIGRTS